MKRSLEGNESSSKGFDTKKTKSQLPSRDEQLVLNQTSILARENLINLQVNGMLEEVNCDKVYQNKKISHCIDNICELLRTAACKKLNSKYCDILKIDNNVKQQFKPPSHVQVIGSYDLQLITSPYINIDICCTIPDNYFDHRYVKIASQSSI